MKRTIIIVGIILSINVFAENANNYRADNSISQEQRAANLARMYQRTGGYISRPNTLKGKLFVLNAQKNVPESVYKKSVSLLLQQMRVDGVFDTLSTDIKLNEMSKIIKDKQAALAVIIVDAEELETTLLVAPEARWAIVNINKLKIGAQNDAFVKTRLEKEVVRAILYIAGACNSQYPNSLMRGITNPNALDSIDSALAPLDVIGRTREYLPYVGISPNMKTTYALACKEGWAPAPTNEVQKAIWDKVHEVPTEPLKIKPEKHPAK